MRTWESKNSSDKIFLKVPELMNLIIRPPVVAVQQLDEEERLSIVAPNQDWFVPLVYPVSQLILDTVTKAVSVIRLLETW